jgi:hypothetical protein
MVRMDATLFKFISTMDATLFKFISTKKFCPTRSEHAQVC